MDGRRRRASELLELSGHVEKLFGLLAALVALAVALGGPAWLTVAGAAIAVIAAVTAAGLRWAAWRANRADDTRATPVRSGRTWLQPRHRVALVALVAAPLVWVGVDALRSHRSAARQGAWTRPAPGAEVRGRSGLVARVDVGNVTRGDRTYQPVVRIHIDDVVKVHVWYRNSNPERELNGLTARLRLPTTTGLRQEIGAEITADGETLSARAVVQTSMGRTRLNLVPDSILWRHRKAGDPVGALADERLPDASLAGTPPPLGSLGPGEGASITLLLRAVAEVLSVVTECKPTSSHRWAQSTVARTGDVIPCRIVVRNESNAILRDVQIHANLAPSTALVDASVRVERDGSRLAPEGSIVDARYPTGAGRPQGRRVGLGIGSLDVGRAVIVYFAIRIGAAKVNDRLRPIGIARASGTNEIFNPVVIEIPS